jgi:stringent starvation protein B
MGQSTKPYLIRAIYDWCVDNGFTPYISVRVIDDEFGELMGYVRNGEITLNVSAQATPNITFGNEIIACSARFNGASRELCIPVVAVSAIFARENGQGMSFAPSDEKPEAATQDATAEQKTKSKKSPSKPKLEIIK